MFETARYNIFVKPENGVVAFESQRRFIGDFHVVSSGQVKRGHRPGIHTFQADAALNTIVEYDRYALYFVGRAGRLGLPDYMCKKGEIFLLLLDASNAGMPSLAESRSPIHTLDGLYSKTKDASIEGKVIALQDELWKHARFIPDFLPVDKSCALASLEDSYRNRVSDQ